MKYLKSRNIVSEQFINKTPDENNFNTSLLFVHQANHCIFNDISIKRTVKPGFGNEWLEDLHPEERCIINDPNLKLKELKYQPKDWKPSPLINRHFEQKLDDKTKSTASSSTETKDNEVISATTSKKSKLNFSDPVDTSDRFQSSSTTTKDDKFTSGKTIKKSNIFHCHLMNNTCLCQPKKLLLLVQPFLLHT